MNPATAHSSTPNDTVPEPATYRVTVGQYDRKTSEARSYRSSGKVKCVRRPGESQEAFNSRSVREGLARKREWEHSRSEGPRPKQALLQSVSTRNEQGNVASGSKPMGPTSTIRALKAERAALHEERINLQQELDTERTRRLKAEAEVKALRHRSGHVESQSNDQWSLLLMLEEMLSTMQKELTETRNELERLRTITETNSQRVSVSAPISQATPKVKPPKRRKRKASNAERSQGPTTQSQRPAATQVAKKPAQQPAKPSCVGAIVGQSQQAAQACGASGGKPKGQPSVAANGQLTKAPRGQTKGQKVTYADQVRKPARQSAAQSATEKSSQAAPAKPKLARKKPFLPQGHTSEAVIVPLPAGESYSSVLSKLKSGLSQRTDRYKIQSTNMTGTKNVRITVSGRGQACHLKSLIEEKLEGITARACVPVVALFIGGIDPDVTVEGIAQALTALCVPAIPPKVSLMRQGKNGLQSAKVVVDRLLAERALEHGRLTFGWNSCRVRLFAETPRRCYNCHRHVSHNGVCPSVTSGQSLAGSCVLCGSREHSTKGCSATGDSLKCRDCMSQNEETQRSNHHHRSGTRACPIYRRLLTKSKDELKQAAAPKKVTACKETQRKKLAAPSATSKSGWTTVQHRRRGPKVASANA